MSLSVGENGRGPLEFSLFFFSNSEFMTEADKYRLLLETAKYADANGFSAVWLPERHFTKEGGLYPNPAVLQAALARETSRIQLRAGSVVMPLHSPISVAEDWALVDNLSRGRVGLSFASGWHPNDFVLSPESYHNRYEEMYRGIEAVRRLWRGEALSFKGGDGNEVEVRIYPTPLRPELPVWVTASNSRDTFVKAGEIGANLLTNLLNQSFEDLADKLVLYRRALAANGHDPEAALVTVALPTFVGGEEDLARGVVQSAVTKYIRSASHLLKAVTYSREKQVDFTSLSEQELDEYLLWVADRMISQKRMLFGTPESCLRPLAELKAIGVGEIAYQLDFGLDVDLIISSMPYLSRLNDLCRSEAFLREAAALAEPAQPFTAQAAATSHAAPNGSASGRAAAVPPETASTKFFIGEVQARCAEEAEGSELLGRLRRQGDEVGIGAAAVKRLWRSDGEALWQVGLEAFRHEASPEALQPVLLDACFHTFAATLPNGGATEGEAFTNPKSAYVPVGLRSLRIHGRPEGLQVWAHALLRPHAGNGETLDGDLRLLDEEGNALVEALGLKLRRIEAGNGTHPHEPEAAADAAPQARAVDNGTARAAASQTRAALLAADPEKREPMLRDYICGQVARVLELPASQVDLHQSVNNMGLDSLMAVQLKNRIEGELGVAVPVTTFLRGASVVQMTEQLLSQLAAAPTPAVAAATADSQAEHPLSSGQRALWVMEQFSEGGASYNTLELALMLHGEIEVPALRRALQGLVDRHASLRTVYRMSGQEPVQVVLPPGQEISFRSVDASDWADASLIERLVEESQRPINLESGPLLRVSLFKRSESRHLLLIVTHHIAIDFLSLEIITDELRELYFAERVGAPASLPEPSFQYTDFVRWQREMLAGQEGERLWDYWRGQLAGELPVLNLPTDRPRPSVPTLKGSIHKFELDEELTLRLRALAKAEGVTLYTLLLSAFYVLLYRYTRQEDIIISSPMVSRSRSEFERIVGYFANPVLMRSRLAAGQTFRELVAQVNGVVFGALDNQDYPFALIVERLQPTREPGRSPLSDVVFNMDRPLKGGAIGNMLTQEASGELSMEPFLIEQRVARYDLVLLMVEAENAVSSILQYKTDLFEPATVARLAEHYLSILRSVMENADNRIDRIEMLSEAERGEQSRGRATGSALRARRGKGARRRTVDLSEMSLVKTGYLGAPGELPLVLTPEVVDVDLAEWSCDNRDFIEAELLRHGALLFRGFGVPSVDEFERFAKSFCDGLYSEYGDLPRQGLSGNVYTSTPYPPDHAILPHNESSQMHCWPTKIMFHCVEAATRGGETPVYDGRRVFRLLRPEIKEEFLRKGVMYVRNFTDGLDVSWQDFFRTSERARVEEYCRGIGIDFEWKADGGLRTRKLCPAVIAHPKTGELAFFNQIQAHHVSCLEPSVRRSMLSLFELDDLPRNVYYGDGSVIEDAVMDEIRSVYEQVAVRFRWQVGDIIMLDNMLCAHARDPYVGRRRIVVSMGQMVDARAVQSGEALLETAGR